MSWITKLSPWANRHEHIPCDDVVGQARKRKAAAVKTRGEVEQLTDNLDAHRRTNHFGETIEKVFKGVA